MKKTVLILLILGLFPFVLAHAQQSVSVTLGGHNHVPPVPSSGYGLLTVTLESDTLFVEGSFQDLNGNYRSSSIHYGSPRESGNSLLRLRAELAEDHRSGTFHREENYFVLRPSILQALRDGNLYINIGTSRRQSGEIRGQISPMR